MIVLSVTFAASACGPAAGTQPHDMSAADHQAAAAHEEQEASQHADQHDPAATQTVEHCPPGKGRVCWTATTNPTEGHGKTAEEHRELAQKHRAASQALHDAETRACAGLSDEDRDVSPFFHVADVRGVTELKAQIDNREGGVASQQTLGATVTVAAVPGLTAEWLQRIVDCHLARNAAVGHEMPEMAYCPLVPKGAQAKVRSVGDGFAVDIQSEDRATAAEILRRAQQLSAGH
jgi:hypothetical protein